MSDKCALRYLTGLDQNDNLFDGTNSEQQHRMPTITPSQIEADKLTELHQY
jgi:hypothetical protein